MWNEACGDGGTVQSMSWHVWHSRIWYILAWYGTVWHGIQCTLPHRCHLHRCFRRPWWPRAGRRVRVRALVRVFAGRGGGSSPFSRLVAVAASQNARPPREQGSRGGIPPSPVTLGTIECLEAILLKNQLSHPTAHAPKSMCQEGWGDYRDRV
jgi:hypothetical protein